MIGHGSGSSGQEYELGATAVEPNSLVIMVEEERGMNAWRQVPDVGAAARGDAVYSLDPEAGTIRFGDNVNGRAPGAGRAIQVASMRAGGGAAGNIPAQIIKQMAAIAGLPKVKLNQPVAMSGGAEAESLDQAELRIPASLRHRDRAVTAQDCRELAAATPGVQIGRVELIERFRPHNREEAMPGAVSVMILPASNRMRAPAPRPDRPILETVHRWLDERRPLATEMYVIGTEYRPIGVSVAVQISDSDNREQILQAVTQTVHRLLWPLAPGGNDGAGWGLGESVDDRIIESMVARVPGVLTVSPVKLFTRSSDAKSWLAVSPDIDGRTQIALQKWQLPELVSLGVGEGGEASNNLPDMASGSASDSIVAVPVVPEHC